MGEFELGGARELIDGFVAQLQCTRRKSWDGAGEGCCSRLRNLTLFQYPEASQIIKVKAGFGYGLGHCYPTRDGWLIQEE